MGEGKKCSFFFFQETFLGFQNEPIYNDYAKVGMLC